MTITRSWSRRDRREVAVSIDTWVTVDEASLAPGDASVFSKRSSAIRLYAAGASLHQIADETGVSSKELYRFLDRCESVSPTDQRLNGWRGIIPREHVLPRQVMLGKNVPSKGNANRFTRFLANYPVIAENLRSLAIRGWRADEKGRPARKLGIKKILFAMHEDCRRAGLGATDYPLCVDSGGYGSVRLFVLRTRQETAGKGPAGGISDLPPVTRCYQRCEADGHKKDLICTVEVASPTSRGVYYASIERLWIIPIIESESTAALGYSIAYGWNYSGADLTRAIRSTAIPWKPMQLTAPGLNYPKLGGFPSGIDSKLAYICCDEILLDNHKGHLSEETVSQLHKVLGATPVYGSIDNQNARACAECFFYLLEERLHQLPNSTGSDPKSKPVKDPTGNAIRYHITDQHITEIAEVALAAYNAQTPPGSSLSRIEILLRYVNDPRSLVRRIPVCQRDEMALYDIVLDLTIRGSERTHVEPHVYWHGSDYTNPAISSAYGLIGTKLKCYADSMDIRRLKAFFPSGADAGELLCERRYRRTAHSVTTRKHANASRRRGGHRQDNWGDDIAGYTNSVTDKARNSKVAATELARLNAEARYRAARGDVTNTGSDETVGKKEARATEPESLWAERLKRLGTQF